MNFLLIKQTQKGGNNKIFLAPVCDRSLQEQKIAFLNSGQSPKPLPVTGAPSEHRRQKETNNKQQTFLPYGTVGDLRRTPQTTNARSVTTNNKPLARSKTSAEHHKQQTREA